MERRKVRIGGFVEDGALHNVHIEVEIKHHRYVPGAKCKTIEHEPIWEFDILSISSATYRGRHDYSGGQDMESVAAVTAFADGWDAAKRDRLLAIWKEWHLNHMQAGCAHQTVEYEQDRYGRTVPSLDKTEPCPITGYRYGSAWLVIPLPTEIIAEVEAMFMGVRA